MKLLFRLWLRTPSLQGKLIRLAGRHLVNRIVKNYRTNTEGPSAFSERATRDNSRQVNRVNVEASPSANRGIWIGLFVLGVLVVLSLLVLVPALWLH